MHSPCTVNLPHGPFATPYVSTKYTSAQAVVQSTHDRTGLQAIWQRGLRLEPRITVGTPHNPPAPLAGSG
eukprot:581225-Prorocentrum_minimum.AAC.6